MNSVPAKPRNAARRNQRLITTATWGSREIDSVQPTPQSTTATKPGQKTMPRMRPIRYQSIASPESRGEPCQRRGDAVQNGAVCGGGSAASVKIDEDAVIEEEGAVHRGFRLAGNGSRLRRTIGA